MMYAFVAILCMVLLLPSAASAHVLIADTAKNSGAILHITPDDDPIAGDPSQLFFDIQPATTTSQTHAFTLKVINNHGDEEVVPIQIANSTISATYTFPRPAAYTVQLVAEPLDPTQPTLLFTHAQRVTRGGADMAEIPSHAWAEAGLWFGVVAGCALMVVGYNHRKEIAVRVQKGV